MRIACEHLHQPEGWLSPGTLALDDRGWIRDVQPGADPRVDVRLDGFVIPGIGNLHSHAFQRALAGFAQMAGPDAQDSFWTWRVRMYRLANLLTPDDLRAIAAQLYLEMMEAGFTAVGEFQYLHHQPDGRPYDDRIAMSAALVDAAEQVGLPITVLPVAYFAGGFGQPPGEHQRRFVHRDADTFLRHWADVFGRFAPTVPAATAPRSDASSTHVVGVAPHSLRAVPPAMLDAVVKGVRSTEPHAPIHIHIAEQPEEVRASIEYLGQRPIAWLLANQPLDPAWCLVHATHATGDELDAIARSTAVVGLCPTTEADLGDGIFDGPSYVMRGGVWGIGSDAHAQVSVTRELALLEWGQRLRLGRRNVLAQPSEHVGRRLFDGAATGGATALGQPAGALVPGRRADFVVLDRAHPRIAGHGPDTVLDAWIFGGADDAVNEVWVRGQRRVEQGRHPDRLAVREAFRACLDRLGPSLS